MGARGKLIDRNWRTSEDKHATIDDISVFVIPLQSYQIEHSIWDSKYQALRSRISSPKNVPVEMNVPQRDSPVDNDQVQLSVAANTSIDNSKTETPVISESTQQQQQLQSSDISNVDTNTCVEKTDIEIPSENSNSLVDVENVS